MEVNEIIYEKFKTNNQLIGRGLSITSFVILCRIATDTNRRWRAKDFEDELGLTYLGALNAMKRLRKEGLIDKSGLILPYGLDVACWRPDEERSNPINEHSFFLRF